VASGDPDAEWDVTRERMAQIVMRDIGADSGSGSFSRKKWAACADHGLLGLPIPPTHGGSGWSFSSCAAAMEGLGHATDDRGMAFAVCTHLWACTLPLFRFGTPAQRDRYVPGLVTGRNIGALAMTESEAGSDTSAIRTRAARTSNGFVLDGQKIFITNAPVADVFIVFARMADAHTSIGTTAFILERCDPGLSTGKPIQTLGLSSAAIGGLELTDCAIPEDRVLGRIGGGDFVFNDCMELERTYTFASGLGSMRRTLESAIRRARDRIQFGRRISDFQSVSDRLVNAKVALEMSELMLRDIAARHDRGQRAFLESSMFKLMVSESLVEVSMNSMQLHGAAGYLSSADIALQLQDALASRVYSGTSAIQRRIISRHLGL